MNIVVVGGGLAAANAVEELREQGYEDDLTLVAAEPHLPYERPPLSKGLLLGTAEPDSVFAHDAEWYDAHQVEVLTGSRAEAIDLERGRVTLADRELAYDRLLLATGATPRRLADGRGGRRPRSRYLRTLEDSVGAQGAADRPDRRRRRRLDRARGRRRRPGGGGRGDRGRAGRAAAGGGARPGDRGGVRRPAPRARRRPAARHLRRRR